MTDLVVETDGKHVANISLNDSFINEDSLQKSVRNIGSESGIYIVKTKDGREWKIVNKSMLDFLSSI